MNKEIKNQKQSQLFNNLLPIFAVIIPCFFGILRLIPISFVFILSGILYLILSNFFNSPSPFISSIIINAPLSSQNNYLAEDIISQNEINNLYVLFKKNLGNLIVNFLPLIILITCSTYLIFSLSIDNGSGIILNHGFDYYQSEKWVIKWLDLYNMTLQVGTVGFPNYLFTFIFLFALASGLLYAFVKSAHPLEICGALIYGGSAIGITLTDHLMTVFIFLEFMAMGSGMILWASPHKKSERSSFNYLAVHIFSGVLFFIGLAFLYLKKDSLSFISIVPSHIGHYLIIIALLINIAAPPFCYWISNSYPKSSASGGVFLSTFTTKTNVFILLILLKGQIFLTFVGTFMIFYGIIYALNCQEFRKILSYCIVSQCGYMVFAIGLGSQSAIIAVSILAIAHILYKGLLMMIAGSVIAHKYSNSKQQQNNILINELGNYCEILPFSAVFALLAGLFLSAIPFTLGFYGKIMFFDVLYQSTKVSHTLQNLVILATSAAPLYIGVRWWWLVFLKNSSFKAWLTALKTKHLLISELANITCYLLLTLPLILVTPWLLNDLNLITFPNFKPSLNDLVNQLQMIFASIFIFSLVKKWLIPKHYDLYNFNRFTKLIGFIIMLLFNMLRYIYNKLQETFSNKVSTKADVIYQYFEKGLKKISNVWSTDVMTTSACLLFVITVLFFYAFT